MNKNFILILISIVVFSSLGFDAFAQREVRKFTLEEIIRRAQDNSPAAKQAETRRENSIWEFSLYKSDFNPQLRLSGEVPSYSREFSPIRQPDGTIVFQPIRQTNSTTRLFIQQPLAATGGNFFINSNLNLFNDLDRNNSQWNSTLVNVQLNQPIFAFNQLKWDRKIEPLRFEEAKRSYVEDMELISRTAVERFFGLLEAQVRLQVAQFNLKNTDTIFKIEQGRYNIGTTTEDKVLQVELSLLSEQQNVEQSRLDFQNANLLLRSFIGLNEDVDIELVLPEAIPDFEVDYETAYRYAKEYRSDFLAFERRRIEAERNVAQAKGNRFQVNFTASYGLNNRANEFSDLYIDPNNQQRANISFNVPILDWGRNRARLETALANQRLQEFTIAQDLINFEQEIRTQVFQMEVLRKSIEVSKKSDQVADARYMVAQNRYLIGRIDITDLNIALQDKDSKKILYLNSLRNFWRAYYDLRRLTLYDFQGRRLLYNPDIEVVAKEY